MKTILLTNQVYDRILATSGHLAVILADSKICFAAD